MTRSDPRLKNLAGILLGCSFLGVACLASAASKSEKLLVILSSRNSIRLKEGKLLKAGYFLPELSVPAFYAAGLGYQLVFATPGGIPSLPDPVSVDPKWVLKPGLYEPAKKMIEREAGLKAPRALASITNDELAQYAGVLVPGGLSPLEDLPTDPDVGRILRYFHSKSLPTALISGGPAALLATRVGGDFVYKSYRIAAATLQETRDVEAQPRFGGGHLRLNPQEALVKAGVSPVSAPEWQPQVTRDREILTAQNPPSVFEFATTFMELLIERKVAPAPGSAFPAWDPDKSNLSPPQGVTVRALPNAVNWETSSASFSAYPRNPGLTDPKYLAGVTEFLKETLRNDSKFGLQSFYFRLEPSFLVIYEAWENQEKARWVGTSPPPQNIQSLRTYLFDPIRSIISEPLKVVPSWMPKT